MKMDFLKIATFLCILSLQVLGAQHATVVSERAVIYSDMEMQSAIGYVKKGRKIRVGEITRNKGRVLPVVVSGRIAYIKVDDLQTSQDLLELESASDRVKKGQHKPKNSRFELGYSYWGTSFTNAEPLVGNKTKDLTLSGTVIRGHVLNPKQKKAYRLSLEYISGEVATEAITTTLMGADAMWRGIRMGDLKARPYLGVTLCPWSQYEIKNEFKKNGWGYGAYGGVDISYEQNFYLLYHLDFRYEYLTLTGFEIPDAYLESFEPTFTGFKFMASMSYRF